MTPTAVGGEQQISISGGVNPAGGILELGINN